MTAFSTFHDLVMALIEHYGAKEVASGKAGRRQFQNPWCLQCGDPTYIFIIAPKSKMGKPAVGEPTVRFGQSVSRSMVMSSAMVQRIATRQEKMPTRLAQPHGLHQ